MSLRIPSTLPADDQSRGTGPATSDQAPSDDHAPQQGGFFAEGDIDPSKRLSGPMILGIVVVIAAALLVGMRQLGIGASLDMLSVKIDYPLDGEGGPKKDHGKILADLKTAGVEQVPLDEIRMNPFEWKALRSTEAPKIAEPDAAELSRRDLEQRKHEVREAFAKLQLNSVMAGRVPVARISGEMVKVGDTVAQHFKVIAISGRSVEMVAMDETFSLSLEAASSKP